MASLTEKFKSTFNGTSGTTACLSFLQVTPVESKTDFKKVAPKLIEIETNAFPRLPRLKAINMILSFHGFLDETQDLMRKLSHGT